MTDILGNVLTGIIILCALGYALYKAYQWAKKEGLVGGKKMGIFDKEQKPEWEKSKYRMLHRGRLSLAELDEKEDEGWEHYDTPVVEGVVYYYFRKVR